MSTASTPYGVDQVQVYDFAYISGLDMEPYSSRYTPGYNGTYTMGSHGYITLNITQLSWTSAYGAFTSTDKVFADLQISGFNPITMTEPTDTGGVPLTRYLITSPTGTINFSGTNAAKYVWMVQGGVPVGVTLNEDHTFTAARLIVSAQENNVIPHNQPIVFTLTYTLTFTDLGSTISGAVTSSTSTLTTSAAALSSRKMITTSVFSGINSGYVGLVIGQIASSSTLPMRTADFVPHVDSPSSQFSISLWDGTSIWMQEAARAARTKVFNNPSQLFALYAVNQGKISGNSETLDTNYHLANFRLDRGGSDDNASVTVNYAIISATV